MRRGWLVMATAFLLAVGTLSAAEGETPLPPPMANPDATSTGAAPATPTATSGGAAMTPNPAPKKAEKDIFTQAWETFQRGGSVMWVLLAVSVVGATFVMERFLGLRRGAHVPAKLLEDVQLRLRAEGADAARLRLAGNPAALARVLDGVLRRKGLTRAEMETVLEGEIERALWDLRLNLRPVGIAASLAPLLGLLGTVFGLIQSFQKAAELGMDDPRNFAEGIYVALYTTAFGLSIAIPLLIAYHYLRGRADVIMREVEELGIRFVVDANAPAVADAKPAA